MVKGNFYTCLTFSEWSRKSKNDVLHFYWHSSKSKYWQFENRSQEIQEHRKEYNILIAAVANRICSSLYFCPFVRQSIEWNRVVSLCVHKRIFFIPKSHFILTNWLWLQFEKKCCLLNIGLDGKNGEELVNFSRFWKMCTFCDIYIYISNAFIPHAPTRINTSFISLYIWFV